MRSTPSPNPFDRLMGWLRLSRGEGPAWEGWARRACPPVLCSVFVFKRNLLRVSFHSAERFDCAKGRASRDLGPFAQIICGAGGMLCELWAKSVENVPKSVSEFVAAPQPARAAGTHRSRVLCTQWDPGSAQIQQE